MLKRLLIGLALSSILLGEQLSSAFAQGDMPFRGKPLPQVLQVPGTVTCFADTAAVTGFYRSLVPEPDKPDVVLQSSPLKSQTAGGGYKISLAEDQATVRDEVLKESHQFHVYTRRADGVILIRVKGVGVEVITIDPRNGSFLLTDAGVQTLWNRANVWAGRCY